MSTEEHSVKTFQVSLIVDRHDVIESVSSSWTAVAEQGGAAESLLPDKVIDRPLAVFIRSDSTRMYIESCLKVCRLKQQVLFREYRCDSLTHQRFMELQLTPLDNLAVEMKHFLLREVPFAKPVRLKDVSDQPEGQPKGLPHRFVRCSMCNSLKAVGSHHWVAPENLSQPLAVPIPVIHSVCPACLNKIWQKRQYPD